MEKEHKCTKKKEGGRGCSLCSWELAEDDVKNCFCGARDATADAVDNREERGVAQEDIAPPA